MLPRTSLAVDSRGWLASGLFIVVREKGMSTITAVQKNGMVAIAADQMTSSGSRKCLAEYRSHPTKIVHIGESLIGVAGSTAHLRVLESLARNHADKFDLNSTEAIFETFRRFHKLLVEEYYLLTEETDEAQPYQSTQMNILIANRRGLYEVQGYREVMQYEKFWATGSGEDFALGAMEVLYNTPDLTAQQIAEKGVEVGCRFDDGSGLPVESYAVELGGSLP
jgi:ATP-dependent HslUV protease subunit HslV